MVPAPEEISADHANSGPAAEIERIPLASQSSTHPPRNQNRQILEY